MPTYMPKTAMPCHLFYQPCHAVHNANHTMPSTTSTMPCHPQCQPCHAISLTILCYRYTKCLAIPTLNVEQLDAIALSPAHNHDRGRPNTAGRSSPTKRPCAQSPSRSWSHSHSHSPAHHHRRRYVSPSAHGRHTRLASSSKGKGRGSNPLFFQSGTAASGTSACAVCLGCHKHEYTKCSATKLWNGKKTFVQRNEQGRLVFLDSLPICFNFQTMPGCSDTSHTS